MVRDSTLTLVFLRLIVEHHDLVVVAGGNYLSLSHIEAPDFTLEVRLHDDPFLRGLGSESLVEFKDRAVAKTD